MNDRTDAKELVRDLFEEEALLVGGLVAVHRIDDDAVWALVKGLDALREKYVRRAGDRPVGGETNAATDHRDPPPHPAIDDFLFRIRNQR